MTTEKLDSTKVIEMITRLRRAVETLQRFGEGTRSARRIRKTLLKLVQICTIVQCNPDHGPGNLSALSSNLHSDTAQVQSQHGPLLHHQQGGSMDAAGVLNSNLSTIAPDDPFMAFDMTTEQYWPDNNLDLFTDLVGVETGLTAMMAG